MPNCWGVDIRSGSKGCRIPPDDVVAMGEDASKAWCEQKFCEDGFTFTCYDVNGPSQCISGSACNGAADWQNADDIERWEYRAYAHNCCVEVGDGFTECVFVFTARCFAAGGRPFPDQFITIRVGDSIPGEPFTTDQVPYKHLNCSSASLHHLWPECLEWRPCCRDRILPQDLTCNPFGGYGGTSRFNILSCCNLENEQLCTSSGGTRAPNAWHCCDRTVQCGSGDACCTRLGGCISATREQCDSIQGRFIAGADCSGVICGDFFELECVQDRWVPALRPDEHANVGTYEFAPDSWEVVSKVPVETVAPTDATLGRNCIQQYGRIESEVTEAGLFGARICNDYADFAGGGGEPTKHTVQDCVVTFNDEGDAEFACGYRQTAFTG